MSRAMGWISAWITTSFAVLASAPVAAEEGRPQPAGQERPAAGDAHHPGHAQGSPPGLAPAPLPPDSIYQLDSLWTSATGEQLRLAALGGRVTVLAMVYTHCQHACPRIIADMRRLRSELREAGDRVGYALVSLDPERDDVERLAQFAEKTGLGSQWTLLRGDEGSVRELSAALGIRYKRVSADDFVHSNLLSILDPAGVVVHRQIGLGVDPFESAERIRAMLEAE